MTDSTAQKSENFYQRMERLQDETSDLREKAYARITSLADAFEKAAPADRKAIREQMHAAGAENDRLREQYRDLVQQQRNPPWIKLSEAMLNGNYSVVEELTRDGTMIKLMNAERVSVLTQPAYAGDEKILDLLLLRGANPNTPGHDNLTPLLLSVFKDNAGIFKKLLAAGADINARTTVGDGVRELARMNDAKEVKKIIKTMGMPVKKPAVKKAPKPKN